MHIKKAASALLSRLKIYWHDPVWSKVISTCIVSIVSLAAYFLWPLIVKLSTKIELIFFIISIVALWLGCLYIRFSKVQVGEHCGIQEHKQLRYTSRVRRLALVGIFTVPLLVPVGLFGWRYYQGAPSNKIIVLVANFDGPDEDYGITEIIVDQLREAIEPAGAQVQTLGETITAQQGSATARAKGKEHGASIVLWGWYRKTQQNVFINCHIEAFKQSFGPLSQAKMNTKATVAELESFVIQEQLSKNMKSITLGIMGEISYNAKNYDKAIMLYTQALNQSGKPGEYNYYIYFLRGSAYMKKRAFSQAIEDFNKVINTTTSVASAYTNRGLLYRTLC